MFALAAGFGGGVWVKSKLDQIHLPKFGAPENEGCTFKLSVRVLSASIPALSAPGVWSSQRPKLEVSLGSTKKDTEFADYVTSSAGGKVGINSNECPWRFEDTLTFVAHVPGDLLGDGLRLRLRAHSDFRLGPLQLELSRAQELGEAMIDLRRRVLPACVKGRQRTGASGLVWESPALLFPLLHVKGGLVPQGDELGSCASAHVALAFSVSSDPEACLALADLAAKPFSERVADGFVGLMSEPVDLGWIFGDGGSAPAEGSEPAAAFERGWAGNVSTPANAEPTPKFPRACSVLITPDLPEEGWVSHEGADGRVFWHHTSLGPPPWESSPAKGVPCASLDTRDSPPRAGTRRPSALPRACSVLITPDLPEEGWISHEGTNGRVFWHHTSLGPPPWELELTQGIQGDQDRAKHMAVASAPNLRTYGLPDMVPREAARQSQLPTMRPSEFAKNQQRSPWDSRW